MSTQVYDWNPFEIDNARNLSLEQTVNTYIETRAFKRLMSAKNHVVLGARGSGKTALARMLSHDHLTTYLSRQGTESVRNLRFIGIYVPTRLEWVSSLKNKPWHTEEEGERFFQWRFNIATCTAFLSTLRSCIDTYCADDTEKIRKERQTVHNLAKEWLGVDKEITSIVGLTRRINELNFARKVNETLIRVGRLSESSGSRLGSVFELELFDPLRRGMQIVEEHLPLPDNTNWLLILDEAEFLHREFLRILNSHLRSFSGNLFFKITTMPYTYTLDTNTAVPLDEGHDFEYVYIDQGPDSLFGVDDKKEQQFAELLFTKRLKASTLGSERLSASRLLGSSLLLDPKPSIWSDDSAEMGRLRRYAGGETKERAQRLLSTEPKRFENEISRKMQGALLLREAVENLSGAKKLDIYCGTSLISRCSDSNPRRLIRLYNRMISAAPSTSADSSDIEQLSGVTQTDILLTFGASVLRRTQSENECGPQLYGLLKTIGEYMRRRFHEMPMSTDQISSVEFDSGVPRNLWPLFERAVGLGLLFPNVNPAQPDYLPRFEGTFHLAYVLAPHFRLLPRRGRPHKLSTILSSTDMARLAENVLQYRLFEQTVEENDQ